MDPQPHPQERIFWWARQHALILLIGVTAAWLEHSGLLLAAMAGASFLAVFRTPKSPSSDFKTTRGSNLLTAGRILIALGLIAEPQTPAHITSTVLVGLTTLQVIEAWLSRKIRNPQINQALIEQETDGIWLVALSFVVAPLTPLGSGIICLALLRPLGVMVSHWTGAPACTMPWSFGPRLLSGLSLVAISAPLSESTPPHVAQGLAAAGALVWIALHAAWAYQAAQQKKRAPSGLTTD